MAVKVAPFEYPVEVCVRKDSVRLSNGAHLAFTKSYATKFKKRKKRGPIK